MSSMMPVHNTFFFLPFFWFSALCPIYFRTQSVLLIQVQTPITCTERRLASAFAKQLRKANPYHRRSFKLGFYWMRHLGRGGEKNQWIIQGVVPDNDA